MAQVMRDADVVTPLVTRDALYGGRTQSLRLIWERSGAERLLFKDVVS